MKKIMILGAGSCQLNAIKRIKDYGYVSVVSDNRMDSPGKIIADIPVLADTFSYEDSYQAALLENVDGIITSGTDQPVLTVNKVAKALNLPMFLSTETALWVTNKKYMKELFKDLGIPTPSFAFCRKDFKDCELDHIPPPYVIKPVDSQGQRGIYKVSDICSIRKVFDEVLKYSREEEILVESYYKNEEVTITGWVEDGNVNILTITDRVTFSNDDQIGVCMSHEYPSRHLPNYRDTFFNLTESICKGFKIQSGPIYFQYLVGDDGVKVNEIACRIGGAYEDVFVPEVSGVDILGLNILSAVDLKSTKLAELKRKLKSYIYDESGLRVSVQLFFCKSGTVTKLTEKESLCEKPYIMDMGYNIGIGDILPEIENASQRAGFAILTGYDESDLQANIQDFYESIEIMDIEDRSLIIKHSRIFR